MVVTILTLCWCVDVFVVFFFFNDTATTEIYTLSLHDALPISGGRRSTCARETKPPGSGWSGAWSGCGRTRDRKSTRLNSSHANISYAVFCLKKKKKHAHHAPAITPTRPALTTRNTSRANV